MKDIWKSQQILRVWINQFWTGMNTNNSDKYVCICMIEYDILPKLLIDFPNHQNACIHTTFSILITRMLTYISEYISKYHYKICDEITYPFPNCLETDN